MKNIHKFLSDYNNGIITLEFPIIPNIKKIYTIFSDNGWNTMQSIKMEKTDDNKKYYSNIHTNKDISYRFKFSKIDDNSEYYEDNNQNNFYFPVRKLNYQKTTNKFQTISDIINKGKNLLITENINNFKNTSLIFDFDNIFYFHSILENFDFFYYIENSSKRKTTSIKKINDKTTWHTDIFNKNINKDLQEFLDFFYKKYKKNIGFLNLNNKIFSINSGLQLFLNLNLDYYIFDDHIIWREQN